MNDVQILQKELEVAEPAEIFGRAMPKKLAYSTIEVLL